jgi:hypothetical protein
MGFLEAIKGGAAGLAGLGQKAAAGLGALLAGLPKPGTGRRRALLFVALGLTALLGLFAILLGLNRTAGESAPAPPELGEAFQTRPIPPEELFLPGEPDFLPRLRLEREPRDVWTREDAQPYWTGFPAEGAVFLDIAESVIDDLMERVP